MLLCYQFFSVNLSRVNSLYVAGSCKNTNNTEIPRGEDVE